MKVVRQNGSMDCGVCCLLSVIRHYGGNLPIEYLREMTATDRNGVSAYNLVHTAQEIGFSAYGVRGELTDISSLDLPIISHVILNKNLKHFVVIYKIDNIKRKVMIMDPAKGKRIQTFAEFSLMSSNNYIILKPIDTLPNIRVKKYVKMWFKNFSKSNITYLVYIVIFSLLSFFLSIVCGFHFSFLLNNAINYGIENNVLKISMLILVIYVFKEILFLFRNLVSSKFSILMDEYMTKKFYNKLLLLPYMYYKNRTTGEIVSRMGGLGIVKSFLTKLLVTIFTDVLVVNVFLIMLFKVNLEIFFLLVGIIVFFILIAIFNNQKKRRYLSNYLLEEDKINSLFIENLEKITTIKNLHLEPRKVSRFYARYKRLLESSYLVNNNLLFMNTIQEIIKDVFYVLFYLIASLNVISFKCSIGLILILQNILSYFFISFSNILKVVSDFNQYKLSRERIDDLFMIRGDNFSCSNYFKERKVNGTIEFKNLNYSLNTHTLFKNLNLKIYPKEKIFFYGESGSGKSTLMKMLLSYIDVNYGVITIDNIDINHYHLGVLRNEVMYVGQNESLFYGTIKDNVVLYENIAADNLEQIYNITLLDKVIAKKRHGDLEMIENDNYNLSGGERQKIILSRALCKNSSIYIFDEAFSQIDVLEERQILEKIFSYLKEKTVIVISHRMGNMDLYSRTLKLEGGGISDEI